MMRPGKSYGFLRQRVDPKLLVRCCLGQSELEGFIGLDPVSLRGCRKVSPFLSRMGSGCNNTHVQKGLATDGPLRQLVP